jgi:hypothetical protein
MISHGVEGFLVKHPNTITSVISIADISYIAFGILDHLLGGSWRHAQCSGIHE